MVVPDDLIISSFDLEHDNLGKLSNVRIFVSQRTVLQWIGKKKKSKEKEKGEIKNGFFWALLLIYIFLILFWFCNFVPHKLVKVLKNSPF